MRLTRSVFSCGLAVPFVLSLVACGGGHYGTVAANAPGGRSYALASPSQAFAGAPMAYPQQAGQVGVAEAAPDPLGTERTEHFKDYGVNPMVEAKKDRLSTFSIDVDTASYSFARRTLMREGRLPPFEGVRAEEFLNSFDYGYAEPTAPSKTPFAVDFAAAPSPLARGHHLIRVGVQAKHVTPAERSPVHLVYLVDVSGSMSAPDRLPLAQKSLKRLTETLKPGDTVALVTYAGSTRIVLEPTGIASKERILSAIDSLSSGGSTSMGSGIQLAYDLASKTLVKGHVNRVVVLSDGDANVGSTSHEEILRTIAQYKDKGITLSTVGFGSGNYKDVMMEQLADKGDGNYSYIDGEDEAKKVFVDQVDGLLQVVARDVKIQVEFDPNVVLRYRLMGYENRDIADKDFRNDKVDAGEVGAGHSVTALYDVELAPRATSSPLTVRLRAKPAKNAANGGSDVAVESAFTMSPKSVFRTFDDAPENFRFAVAVSSFAEKLRKAPQASDWRYDDIERLAQSSAGQRTERAELVQMIRKAKALSGDPSRTNVAVAK
ncbi:Von Willebrand factor type A domain protein [Labilithrix luteola]|uniref:von Willebrand factor type A domain protein n=1 Tax=Labilithrix luteola TaxID=1391654 RepID=A0A0K1Q0H0_9BACT|nr:von Willebrand factor type A domain-containing protein [Labilithrix luteola]AKU99232.1 Von Willebrand factor type A domain protein [Labilithrix luteola]